jgi:hypothetical protein
LTACFAYGLYAFISSWCTPASGRAAPCG